MQNFISYNSRQTIKLDSYAGAALLALGLQIT